MTPQPDALPACPFCGGANVRLYEEDGSQSVRRFEAAECGDCLSIGPFRKDESSAIAAFTNPAHALAASRAECERLRVALFDTSEVCAALVEGEKCEHDAGICWCAAHESIVHARAALAAQGGGT